MKGFLGSGLLVKLFHSRFARLFLSAVLLLACFNSWHAMLLPNTPKVHASMPIQHIVFLIKENHTFDNYFGLFPGAHGTTTGKVKINGAGRADGRVQGKVQISYILLDSLNDPDR